MTYKPKMCIRDSASVIAFFIMHTAISALISVNYAGGEMCIRDRYELTYSVNMNKDADETKFIDELRCRNGNLNIVTLCGGNAVSYTHLDVYKRQQNNSL